LIDAKANAPSNGAGGDGGAADVEHDPFFDPMNRRWRLSTGHAGRSAAAVKPNQRLQYLCLQEIIKSILVRDKRNCSLGFESNFAQLLADLMDVKFSGQLRQQRDILPLKKRPRPATTTEPAANAESALDSPGAAGGGSVEYLDELTTYPASFLEFQRIM
jgi:hypothetical protein